MDTRIKERCIYCGGDVYYHSGESLMKCDWCGQTIPVMKFQGEMTRMKKTEEENILIKEQLEAAEKEKQAADARLFAALSNLGQIRDDQDTLGKTLSLLINGQKDSLSSLEYVKGISEKLVNSQNDIFAKMDVMQDIRTQLQNMDIAEQERQSFMNEFMLWSQQIRQDDVQRLQGISSSVDTLMEGQREISGKVDELKIAADQHRQTLEAFKAQYSRDKLEKVQKLYRQAEDYQHDRRYDKAEEYYRRMLTEGEEDAEVYWRLIMCHYCMFYEKDNDGRLIPIILNPDLTDPTEMSLRKELALQMTERENANYDTKLQEIDRILDKYRLLKDQVKYDVFISVKQDDGGHYTSDSDVASDLYDFLISHGLRVFNSRRTVIPVGQEYEPYIISALISSKVLIVVGTSPENMNSNWVKNEWSRFQWLQFREKEKNGKTERVLFCYLAKGMRAEQIPRALHPDRQAIYDGVKAQSDLLAGLSFLKKTDTAAEGPGYMPGPTAKPDYDRIRKQMTLWLVRGKFDKVLEKYDQLNEEGLFLSHVSLHMTALCASNKVKDIKQIVNSGFVLEEAPEYQAAILLSEDEKEKQELEDLLVQNREWREKQNNKSIAQNNKEIEKDREPASGQETAKQQYILEGREPNTIRFGRYVQKKNGSPEPIEWQVLERKNGRILVISKYALDCQPYNTSLENVTWETCSLRKWLNETFVNNAFNMEEQKKIVSSKVMADKNPRFGTSPGNNTTDKVFLLSITEVNKYFNSEKARECQGTAYCYAQGAYKAGNNCWWWLRSPGNDSNYATYVDDGGSVNHNGDSVSHGKDAVRPALWIDLESETKKKQEETEKTKAEEENQAVSQETLEEWCRLGEEAYGNSNYEEAAKWFRKAAEKGSAEGQYKLGYQYKKGEGLEKDYKQAAILFHEAAKKGYAKAQRHLGICYKDGEGIEKDLKLAAFWYRKAAEQGEAAAQNNLGLCYDNGIGVEKDLKQAVYWYQKAAEQGNAYAQSNLGYCLKNGEGVEKDLKQAVYWYQKAAEQGDAYAQSNLGYCYDHGEGVEKDLKQAVYWYQKAAEQGNAVAQFNLGLCYENGKGVEQDQKQALIWYQKAADQGDEDAKAKVKQLTKKKRWFF